MSLMFISVVSRNIFKLLDFWQHRWNNSSQFDTACQNKGYKFDQMNIERFHNELAMRLGYECIVKDRRIQISVEESEDPVVSLKVQGCKDIRFKASDDFEYVSEKNQKEIKEIVDAVHQAYVKSTSVFF